MFKATAFIVGPLDGPGAALTDMAKRLGFEAVLSYAGVGIADQQTARTPLLYFLFAAVNDVASLKTTAEAIRRSPHRRVRLAPLIYFSESPSAEAIQACAGMGFDDVLTLPFSRERVVDRLTRQLNRTLVYYETSTYFGPDRRKDAETAPVERRGVHGQARRIEIIRTTADGAGFAKDDARAA